MQAILPYRSNLAQTAFVSLVTFFALALLGYVLAYWSWAWLAPRPEPRAPAAMAAGRPADLAQAAYNLFGNAPREGGRSLSTGNAVTLLGVVAASGGMPGYAILRLDAKRTVAVREGGEIEAGARIAEVLADHVVLERGGVREALAWPEPGRFAAPAVPAAVH
ncbi:MAG TPA: type II secretion system protein N [Burkholderiales bacterium]|nr:type II secretion system protein N [Burkholderiales bacterium]